MFRNSVIANYNKKKEIRIKNIKTPNNFQQFQIEFNYIRQIYVLYFGHYKLFIKKLPADLYFATVVMKKGIVVFLQGIGRFLLILYSNDESLWNGNELKCILSVKSSDSASSDIDQFSKKFKNFEFYMNWWTTMIGIFWIMLSDWTWK